MIPSNYHTHTHFCDGKNSPEEMVLQAISLGCPELGFSGHSYLPFGESYCMSLADTEKYKAEIRRLQEKYAGQIKILLGLEMDYFSDVPTEDYDYVIGSVHAVCKDGRYLDVDHTRQIFMDDVKHYYGGDYYAYAEDYYALVADVYRKTRCQIIGHFDIIAKFNREGDLFDPNHPRYRAAAQKALDSLLDTPAVLEVNTGAMARGYTTAPYPAKEFLSQWLAAGKEVIFSSDCHSAEGILYGYDAYQSLLAECK
jgi:histidinol-phosphatase (PHP family)